MRVLNVTGFEIVRIVGKRGFAVKVKPHLSLAGNQRKNELCITCFGF